MKIVDFFLFVILFSIYLLTSTRNTASRTGATASLSTGSYTPPPPPSPPSPSPPPCSLSCSTSVSVSWVRWESTKYSNAGYSSITFHLLRSRWEWSSVSSSILLPPAVLGLWRCSTSMSDWELGDCCVSCSCSVLSRVFILYIFIFMLFTV